MAETQAYTSLEIQRYLQHKMSPQEMHEFEKALMNDPFLADALDGFSASDASLAEKHLIEIDSNLTGGQQQAKVVPLPVQKTPWWKVAAIILVIISAGVITWSVVNNNSAFNKNKERAVATRSAPVAVEKDSIGPANRPVAKTSTLPGRQLTQNKSSRSPFIHPDANGRIAGDEQVSEASVLADKREEMPIASSAPAAAIHNDEEASAQHMKVPGPIAKNEFKGKVVDKAGEPLPFASIRANGSNVGTMSNGSGDFSLKAADTVLEVNINSPGYVSATTKIKSNNTDNRVALREDELSLSEVVVTGLAKKKRSTAANVQVDSSIAAEPVGGWKSFKLYLNQQLDSLKATDEPENFDENIVLEFSIDKKGQPTNVKAPAELDKMMAKKAIHILTNGPRWKKKKDKKVKVIIAF